MITQRKFYDEVQLSYREYFESTMAAFLLKNSYLQTVVTKISNAILLILKENKNAVLHQIMKDAKISDDLYHESKFGRCEEKRSWHAEGVYKDIITILETSTSKMEQVLQIHCIFVYRIYGQLNTYFNDIICQAMGDCKKLFAEPHRFPKPNNQLSDEIGITRNSVFQKKLHTKTEKHLRALNQFVPNINSSIFHFFNQHHLPFVAGPSGHTKYLLAGAKIYGNLPSEEFADYALACFAFLTTGGNHSFYEVMLVANKFGVPVDEHQYQVSLSQNILTNSEFQTLMNIFPEFFNIPLSVPKLEAETSNNTDTYT